MTAPLATILQDALGRDYRIEQELEGGGMSRLFVATDLRLGRRVVVKVLPPEFVTDETTARFRREIELTVRLQHPHILPVLTSGSWEDVLWYITPYIAGESLRARLARDVRLPLGEILKILRDVSGALAFAHARGIVHRDIKPGNILLAEGHAILADFGIARAVGTSGPRLTGSGMMLGTPAYMAPEVPSDESADVYALGVVACEMLCGELPRRGATAKELVVKRGSVAGDDRATLDGLARLIASALSEAPQVRLGSAALALERLQFLSQPQPRRRVRLARALAALVALAGLAGGFALLRGARLDGNAYALIATAGSPDLKSELQHAYADALSEWDGVRLVNRDVTGVPDVHVSLSDAAVSAARHKRARNALAVEGERSGDSLIVRATLYDARADTAIRSTRVAALASDAGARLMALRRSVSGLLRTGPELPWLSAGDHTRPSLAAWRSYDAGRRALQRWNLDSAETSFRTAIGASSAMPLAHLWLANTLLWKSARNGQIALASDVRGEARRALDAPTRLTARDSLRAAVLMSLAEGDFRSGCSDPERLVASDSGDVTAWLDLGDCRTFDDLVRRNPASRTGWSFQSSYEAAAAAYRRAGDLGPTDSNSPFQGWLLGRLSDVLYTAPNHVRRGYRVDRDTLRYAAFPVLDRDTLAFDPFPMNELSSGRSQPPPDAIQAAVMRSRALLRRAAEDWVRRAPGSAAAYDSLAAWVEVSGGLATIEEHTVPALDVVRRARRLATEPTERLHLAVADVRLLLKNEQFVEARVEAESLLAAGAGLHVPYVPGVAGLALLVGHPEEAARIFARSPDTRFPTSRGDVVALPAQLVQENARLLAYTSLGIRDDTVAAAITRAESLIDSYFPDPQLRAGLRASILTRPLIGAYPLRFDLLERVADPGDPVARAYILLAEGDTAGARAAHLGLQQSAHSELRGFAVDGTYRRAALALALHDTAGAINHLDPVLHALPMLAPTLLAELPQVGSLLTAMVLRADIAERRADHQTARACARAIVGLWKNADPGLRPVLQRMLSLSN